MLSETQMGALRVLEALEDKETAYVVNMSNPVCPCCGAKLIIQDDTEPGQNEELNTEMMSEQFADPEVILPLIREVANDLISGYTDYCRTAGLDDRQIATALCYPRDPNFLDALQRKAKELKSTFATGYGLLVHENIIAQDLRDAIKKIAKNGNRY